MERGQASNSWNKVDISSLDPDTWRNRTLGQTVKAWRAEKKLKLQQVADASGLSTGYISMVETDRVRAPHDQQLLALASGLELPHPVLLLRLLPEEFTINSEI